MKPAQWKSRTEPRGHSRNRTLCVALQALLHRSPSQQVSSTATESSSCENPPEQTLWVAQPFTVAFCPSTLTSGGREKQKSARETVRNNNVSIHNNKAIDYITKVILFHSYSVTYPRLVCSSTV